MFLTVKDLFQGGVDKFYGHFSIRSNWFASFLVYVDVCYCQIFISSPVD